MRRLITICALFNFLNINAQMHNSITVEKIDKLFNHAIKNDAFNGAAIISQNGEIIYKKVNGINNIDNGSLNRINSLFSIGSVSKQYCGFGIMFLNDKGLLNVDDKFSKYFPDYPQGEKFTIRNLLNHTAGIPNWTNSNQHSYFRVKGRLGDFNDNITDKVVYDYLKKLNKLDFTPGEKYSYSNSGYVLLSHLISKISNMPYSQFMRENIFIPIGLNNMYVNSDPNLDKTRRAVGFTNFGIKDDNNLMTGGDGGIYTTVEDMHKWNQIIRSRTFLSKKAYKEIFKIPKLNNGKELRTNNDYSSNSIYGFGWIFTKQDGEDIFKHDGGINAISAINYVDIKRKFEIIMVSNKGTNTPLVPLHENIMSILKNEPFELYKMSIHIKLKAQIDKLGIENAVKWYNSLNKKNNLEYNFEPNSLNRLGYFYLDKEEVSMAKKIFQINLQQFMDNGNLWDSYAEAFYRNKEYLVALSLYEKSLQLSPDNKNAKTMIELITTTLNNKK